MATAQASIEGMPPSTTIRAVVLPRERHSARVPSAAASQARMAGSKTWAGEVAASGPSAPFCMSAKTSASSNEGAWQASSPHGATAKLEPGKTSASQHPTPPTPTTQAPMASASARKRDSESDAPRALAASSMAKP